MVRAPNQGKRGLLGSNTCLFRERRGAAAHCGIVAKAFRYRDLCAVGGRGRWSLEAAYFAAAAYFLRNLSTRPAVSTIFCLPV